MRAAVIHAPHDLRVEDTPEQPLGADGVRLRVDAGGICGSDLHYYHHGGFGTVRIQEPMILGHEIAGTVVACGTAVTAVRPGDKIAVNPSLPCGICRYCLDGRSNQCLDMRFYGSAMRMPHVQGGFREELVCAQSQAVKLPADVAITEAAFAEPLSVCLHAAAQAGPLLGRRVLVTGTGPIGALLIMVARQAGAREIVATDLLDPPLAMARRIGADRTINTRSEPGGLDAYGADKGTFDVVFEASGAPPALAAAIAAARPGATIVQVGIGANAMPPVPLNTLVAKEINLRGTFRFHEEFAWAVDFITSRRIDVRPLLTEIVPLADAVRGFDLASDRSRAMKVLLAF
ncbi:MAG: L-idonate 5-dehydrogenase [Rhodopila sp.]|jgi:L-idonate 5-dehydrogenase